ncbi:MAG TPA: carbohydrate kinase family protein [Prolixibacteraceae bacterium]
MPGKKIVISGIGCALADFIYLNISFQSAEFRKYLSRADGDGGLSPGKLVFLEELEKYAGKPYADILKEITNGSHPASINLGGPGLVPLIHVSQLLDRKEFSVKFYGFTGNDKISKFVTELLEKTPLDISNYIPGSKDTTPFTDVFSDPSFDNFNGERTFVNNIGAAWDYTPASLPEIFFKSHIVCFGGTALVPKIHDDLTNLLKKAKHHHCVTVVNTVYDFRNEKAHPGEKWPLGNTTESSEFIDILLMDKEEALKISGSSSIETAAHYFQSLNISAFVITNGAENITVYSNGNLFRKMAVSSFPVSSKVKENADLKGDTTGCGDNFAGGLIASIAEQLKRRTAGKLDFIEALSWAIASGGFACLFVGGTFFENEAGEKRKNVEEFKQDYLRQLKKGSN